MEGINCRLGEGTVVAAGGCVGLPKGRVISAGCRVRKDGVHLLPCGTESRTRLLLGGGGLRLAVRVRQSNTVGLARRTVGTGMHTVGRRITTGNGGNRVRGIYCCHGSVFLEGIEELEELEDLENIEE